MTRIHKHKNQRFFFRKKNQAANYLKLSTKIKIEWINHIPTLSLSISNKRKGIDVRFEEQFVKAGLECSNGQLTLIPITNIPHSECPKLKQTQFFLQWITGPKLQLHPLQIELKFETEAIKLIFRNPYHSQWSKILWSPTFYIST